MTINIMRDTHSSIAAVAGPNMTDGNRQMTFALNYGVNFIANDSDTYDLYINFDEPVGRAGTITLKAGEIMSDLRILCRNLYVQGRGGDVPFRAVGS